MTESIALPVLTAIGSVAAAAPCDHRQPDLVVCPSPVPPRITELAGGSATLQLTVSPSGAVTGVRLVQASGTRRGSQLPAKRSCGGATSQLAQFAPGPYPSHLWLPSRPPNNSSKPTPLRGAA